MTDGIIADYREGSTFAIVEGAKIAQILNVPFFYVRKQKKYGLMNTIEGDLKVMENCKDLILISEWKNLPADKSILIEDVEK